jgi:hypothetical protein
MLRAVPRRAAGRGGARGCSGSIVSGQKQGCEGQVLVSGSQGLSLCHCPLWSSHCLGPWERDPSSEVQRLWGLRAGLSFSPPPIISRHILPPPACLYQQWCGTKEGAEGGLL